MKVLIIEDENYAVKRLKNMLSSLEPTWVILAVIDEVSLAVDWLKTEPQPDVIFMDIQLADGFSFEIFNQVKITSPVVFTTAFDQYALEAFQVNGLDYLLKPLDKNRLRNAIEKVKKTQKNSKIDYSKLMEMIQQKPANIKERFLVKKNDQMWFIEVKDIAYFNSESSYTFLHTKKGNKYILEQTIEEVIKKVDPNSFFQINRKMIVGLHSIQEIHYYFNNRFKLTLNPLNSNEVIVSRNRSKSFKEWLGS